MDELAQRFELERVHQGGAVFDRERLEWLNGQWIRKLSDEDLVERVLPFLVADLRALESKGANVRIPNAEDVRALLPMIRERLPTLSAVGPLVDFLFVDELRVEPAHARAQALGCRDHARGADRRAPASSRVSAKSASRPTSSRRRYASWLRTVPGSRATCSWPSASPSPARPPRRRCSTRSSRWVTSARSSASTRRARCSRLRRPA